MTADGTARKPCLETELRLSLRQRGFSPLPVIGKACRLKEWQKKLDCTPDEIRGWERDHEYARSTGILTARNPALDIDIRVEEAAQAGEGLVREWLGDREGRFLVRFGNAPKRAILFQTDNPFKKIQISFDAPDGSTDQKIEFLGSGQQMVAFGIHPDTGKNYVWAGGEPSKILRDELPYISEDEAQALVQAIARLLIDNYGYSPRVSPNKARNGSDGDGQDSARSVGNTAQHPHGWSEPLSNIAAGRELHDSITMLAAKLVASGMGDGAAVELLRAVMGSSTAPHDQRWRDRYDEIPRAVSSARAKREAPPPFAFDPEPYAFPDPAAIPRRQWLYRRHYMRGIVGMTVGAPGRLKSSTVMLELISMAVGRDLMTGQDLEAGPLRAAYLNGEENQEE